MLEAKIWTKNVEDGAMEQINNLCALPFAFHHVAIMPDVHQGYGMPIGGVLATENVVIPNAVGVDIGCGMRAVHTDLNVSDLDKKRLTATLSLIRERIPVGFKHHKEPQDVWLLPMPNSQIMLHEESIPFQIGTLGGGNHFIEIQKDESGDIWVMIHSGSRNVGKEVAAYHNKKAVLCNKQWHSNVPSEWQLAFFPASIAEGQEYIEDMNWCLHFAERSRSLMMYNVLLSIQDAVGPCLEQEEYDVHHNYVALENHYGKNVYVHRKGATRAYEGEIGIIPGSQGTASYIVRGLGNPESFKSCSHGAGRTLSRKKARETLDIQTEKDILESQGILHSVRGKEDLDEAPSAYKDIEEVMENQKDLVEIVRKLIPLAVIKG